MSSQKKVVALPKIGRIASLDLMRGWFLVVIILDHLSYFPNGLSFISGDSRLFVSAAEGFFLISGLVLGIVRGAKLVDQPFALVTKKLLSRSFALYLTSITITAISILIGWYFVGNDGVKSPLPTPWSDIPSLIWRIITFQEFYGWADYLRLYSLFLLFSPAFMWLLRKGRWYIALGCSIAVWFFAPHPTTPMTQPFTWQILFFIALTIGFYLPQLVRFWQRLSKKTQAIITYTLMSVFVMTLAANIISEFVTPVMSGSITQHVNEVHRWVTPMSKLDMPLPRIILSLVWFMGFFVLFRRFEKQITRWLGWLLIPFGTHSLYVYSLHAFVIMGMHLVLNPQYGAPASYFNSFDRVGEIPLNFFMSILAISIIYIALKKKFLINIIPK